MKFFWRQRVRDDYQFRRGTDVATRKLVKAMIREAPDRGPGRPGALQFDGAGRWTRGRACGRASVGAEGRACTVTASRPAAT